MLRVWRSLPPGPLVSRVSPRLITRSLAEGRREVTRLVSLSERKEYSDLLQSMKESEVTKLVSLSEMKEYGDLLQSMRESEVTKLVSLSEGKEYGDLHLLQSMKESEVKKPIDILGEKELGRQIELFSLFQQNMFRIRS